MNELRGEVKETNERIEEIEKGDNGDQIKQNGAEIMGRGRRE